MAYMLAFTYVSYKYRLIMKLRRGAIRWPAPDHVPSRAAILSVTSGEEPVMVEDTAAREPVTLTIISDFI